MNYYVYYKIDPAQMKDIGARVTTLLAIVLEKTGIQGRWMRRRDDPTTYMEVYEGVKDEPAFEALLQREGAAFGVPRKVERFIPAERLF